MTRPDEETLSLAIADPLARDDALHLAAEAWPADERAGQLAAIRQIVADGMAGELVLVAARRGGRLVGAELAHKLAGRSAVVWAPQLRGGENSATTLALLAELHKQLARADVQLCQALLESATSPEANLLLAAGYQHAGDLLYMAADAKSFPAQPPTMPLVLESWTPASEERLARVVEATYRGSLDCPLVDGMRKTADVLAGYRAVGKFRPELWMIAHESNEDVGCLLLADHPGQEQWEIVYLGIAPQFRGRGWGKLLTRHALWLAGEAGRARVVLAVDAANAPAVNAYAECGFAAWDRRSALVRLPQS
jgi:ribosomal protein S18 acetylase RimI-like enzyme